MDKDTKELQDGYFKHHVDFLNAFWEIRKGSGFSLENHQLGAQIQMNVVLECLLHEIRKSNDLTVKMIELQTKIADDQKKLTNRLLFNKKINKPQP